MVLTASGLRTDGDVARPMLIIGVMSKIVFEVRQKNGSLVSARIGATNHTEEAHLGLAEIVIGGSLFVVAVGFVCFLLMI